MSEPWNDDREKTDIEPFQPLGKMPVTFDLAIPSIEQVAGEMARQLLQASGYRERSALQHLVDVAVSDLITKMAEERARPIIEEMLSQPLRPTDAFGNATGETTTLNAVLARRITEWRDDIIDLHGKPGKPDAYNRSHYSTRLERMIGEIVNGQLAEAVAAETRKIVTDMKAGATKAIAVKIAERLDGLFR